jgi:hypothetical protein
MHWYFDDSVQVRGNFAIGAFVASDEDIHSQIAQCLTRANLEPLVDEFKSSSHMSTNPSQAKARDYLKTLTSKSGVRVGLVFVPSTHRSLLGVEALKALRNFLDAGDLWHLQHKMFFDEGSFESTQIARAAARELGLDRYDISFACDSRKILGIQLADLAAHSTGIMLLASLGLFGKTAKKDFASEGTVNSEIDIEWELWTTLRYSFLGKNKATDLDADEIDYDSLGIETEHSGIYISSHCPSVLADAVRERFGFHYLGCIH